MTSHFPKPPFDTPVQQVPGETRAMNPRPDHGEESYHGSDRLKGKKVLLTGGDSGIGRAVAIAFAREGADLAVSYLDEHEDAQETQRLVTAAGRDCILLPGDVSKADHCRELVRQTAERFGRIDVIVNNAAHQMSIPSIEDIPDEEWEKTFAVNISAMFYIVKAAVPHMKHGGSIINTASINADKPRPDLLPYATTKGAIQNFSAGLAQLLAKKGIRVNAVAPGPIWTPLIPSTMPPEMVAHFGESTPMGRPGQPVELAPVYVMLASDEASYVSGATVAVTGGTPFI
ncbi:SDR family oxidoreductase [Segnochrobactrum spirostomi]|uniref:SDR family oxidoreductase n=1 Tax=Segnochrobactrum spirostomi TaxID=2608987 RepID=A0A6A7XZ69_9HYPH|nr:SDR family oxidoreductase [Segnochrobactrum spirostomi]MQT11823.1 SDR family oxidoreductase [Segnochrobactrum spirostomi]